MVREPVKAELTYSDEAVDRVIELTSRQPYLIQCLCNRIYDFSAQTRAGSVTLGSVSEAAKGLVRDNEHFASLWDYAGNGPDTGRFRRQLILFLSAKAFKQGVPTGYSVLREELSQCGVEVDEEALDEDLTYLRELELIDFSGDIGFGEYSLSIPLMAEWIEQQQDADVVASRARIEAEDESE